MAWFLMRSSTRVCSALRQQLATISENVHRRRQVTIVFADVSGFTAMSERLDAEQVADVMNSLWARLDHVIRDHGGRIDKHIGDAVMSMWGADGAREDGPEQAVRAALVLQRELAAFREGHGLTLRMRIGINTGPVLLGGVATTSEFTAIGDAVNVASRLEHAAPVDGVLISHDTYRHVRGVFDVRELNPLVLRGKTDPVRAYVVERVKERAFRVASRGVEGVETRTIGRQSELARLCKEHEQCRGSPGVRLAMVNGEAGVGKSRLLYDFRNWIELRPERVFLFTGRALLGQGGQILGLMRDVIATRFEVLQSDPPSAVMAKLRNGFAPLLNDDEADIVGHWLGFEIGHSDGVTRLAGSPEFATIARAHLFGWFAGLTAQEPGVLLLEDLHWADDETLEVLAHLALRRDMHLLMVGLARPALYERRPDWAPDAVRIDLQGLGADSCRDLVVEVLQHAGSVPGELVELIVARADGNPFYVEELVKMLIDDGVIVVGEQGEPWAVALDRLDQSRVPPTLTGVLQARLDSLPPPERTALQRASVVGRVFWDGAVSALGNADAATTAGAIDGARRRELVYRRAPSAFAQSKEFIFKHALLRDVTYETVLQRDRQPLHAAAASWLETTSGERAAEYREVIAYHLERAGDLAGAASQLLQAGVAAVKAGKFAAGVRALTGARELWDTAHVEADPSIYAPLARVLRVVGRLDEAQDVAHAGLASASVGPAERAQLHYHRSVVAWMQGDHDQERQELEEARAHVDPADRSTQSEIELGIGWLLFSLGDVDGARASANKGLELAIVLGDPGLSSQAEALLGVVATSQGDLELGLYHAEREVAFAARERRPVQDRQRAGPCRGRAPSLWGPRRARALPRRDVVL